MSNNLGLDQVAENQAAKEVTINTATGQLDAALTELLSCDYTTGADITLTSTQYRRSVRFDAVNLTASGKKLILPAIKKMAVVTSAAANTQTLIIEKGSTQLLLTPGASVIIHTDGTANGLVTLGTATSAVKPYDVATYCNGIPDASEVLLRFNYPRAVTLPAGLSGSRITAAVAATATTDFSLTKNGSTIATIRFAAAGTVATVTGMPTDVSFAVNDQLALVSPGTPDATLADIAFTFAGVQ